MASRTIENYLKQLWLEQQAVRRGARRGARQRRARTQYVSMGKLAALVGVTAGTATTMVKAIADSGLVRYAPRAGVQLTRAGEQLALHVLRRHRLLELFLVEVLAIDWSDAHGEAEELEHVVSETVLARIDQLLGHPVVDPHGDPIPSSTGALDSPDLCSLAELPDGSVTTIIRLVDQSPEFLRFAQTSGLVPKTKVRIEATNSLAQAIAARPVGRKTVMLSMAAAEKFLVRPGPLEKKH
ncbi:MAG: metal-dependent transcriptional regulator [Phycisphaerae bacterium]